MTNELPQVARWILQALLRDAVDQVEHDAVLDAVADELRVHGWIVSEVHRWACCEEGHA